MESIAIIRRKAYMDSAKEIARDMLEAVNINGDGFLGPSGRDSYLCQSVSVIWDMILQIPGIGGKTRMTNSEW